ncbi:MAG: hypothetical protein WC620_10585 [Methanoregula sp.]|jgi:hypothetical protein
MALAGYTGLLWDAVSIANDSNFWSGRMHIMYDRISLLACVNDKETSRNTGFANEYFRNAKLQDFLAGLIPSSPDLLYSEHDPQLFKAYQKIRESLSTTDLSLYAGEIARIRTSEMQLIPYDSDRYPGQLRDLSDPRYCCITRETWWISIIVLQLSVHALLQNMGNRLPGS